MGVSLNVASIAGKEGNPNASAYSASKAGVIAFTKSLGKEAKRGTVEFHRSMGRAGYWSVCETVNTM